MQCCKLLQSINQSINQSDINAVYYKTHSNTADSSQHKATNANTNSKEGQTNRPYNNDNNN